MIQNPKSKFSSPSKAALFVENEKNKVSDEHTIAHKQKADVIYNQFEIISDKMFVGRTNA